MTRVVAIRPEPGLSATLERGQAMGLDMAGWPLFEIRPVAWDPPVPDTIEKGTCVSSCVKVKGFRNVIHWKVSRYDEPKAIELQGRGRGGIRLTVAMTVTDDHPGSTFHLTADLGGGLLSGPVGGLVARILRSDVQKSVNNLAALQ